SRRDFPQNRDRPRWLVHLERLRVAWLVDHRGRPGLLGGRYRSWARGLLHGPRDRDKDHQLQVHVQVGAAGPVLDQHRDQVLPRLERLRRQLDVAVPVGELVVVLWVLVHQLAVDEHARGVVARHAKSEHDPLFLQQFGGNLDGAAEQEVLALLLDRRALALTNLVLAVADGGLSGGPLGVIERGLDPLAAGGPRLAGRNVPPRPGARLQQLDRFELLEVVTVPTPADEVALRVVVQLLQAALHPLDFALALMKLLLVPVGETRDDDFLALDNLRAQVGQLVRVTVVSSE